MSSVILICAATSVEAKACWQGIARAKQTERYEILKTGMGLARARTSLEKRLNDLRAPKPSRIISAGFAGSWTRELAVGNWILGKSIEIHQADARYELEEIPLGARPSFPLKQARVITLAQASSQGEMMPKTDGQLLPVAVDMESYAWAEICKSKGIPFQIIRLVSDNPDAPLPASIGIFAAILTSPSAQDKLRFLTRGLSQAVSEPRNLAGFVARGTRLPGLLSQGWQELASQ